MIASALMLGTAAGAANAAPAPGGRAGHAAGGAARGRARLLPLRCSGLRSLSVRLGEPLPSPLVVV